MPQHEAKSSDILYDISMKLWGKHISMYILFCCIGLIYKFEYFFLIGI